MLSFFLSTLALSARSSRTMTTSATSTTSTAPAAGTAALQDLVDTASSWCASHGVLMGARDDETRRPLGDYLYEPAPFSLYPTPFPKTAFQKAYDMAKPFNHVVHQAASNPTWLMKVLKEAAAGDADFTGKLVELASEVLEKEKTTGKPRPQSVVLGVLRSDYMLHAPASATDIVPLQVELNTIASSFGCLSTKLSQLHKHMYGDGDNAPFLPDNGAAEGIAQGLATAVQEYKRQKSPATEPVVVMVVQPGETNSCDQRDLEFLLQQQHGIRMVRQTLKELATTATVNDDSSALLLSSGQEAAVVYYRAGYTPTDYPTASEWEGRTKVEHSAAIKCPDVFYHLFGTKKVQQVLAEPNALGQFCTSDDMATTLGSTFAGLYALGGDNDGDVVEMALQDPEGFVLKPQREGGGNNLYHKELVDALQSMTKEERGAYILMQKILPPPTTGGALVRRGKVVYDGDVVCELGVFGISLRSYDNDASSEPLMDEVVGHILRAKSTQTDEGGVAAGYAFLSSPKLE